MNKKRVALLKIVAAAWIIVGLVVFFVASFTGVLVLGTWTVAAGLSSLAFLIRNWNRETI